MQLAELRKLLNSVENLKHDEKNHTYRLATGAKLKIYIGLPASTIELSAISSVRIAEPWVELLSDENGTRHYFDAAAIQGLSCSSTTASKRAGF